MHVKFLRDHPYEVDKTTGRRRRIPAGWTGTLDDDIAKAAVDAGAAVDLSPPVKEPAAKGRPAAKE